MLSAGLSSLVLLSFVEPDSVPHLSAVSDCLTRVVPVLLRRLPSEI